MPTYEISILYRYKLFIAAEFIYENSFLLCVLHIRLVYNNFKSMFNKKIVTKKMLSIIIPTLINCGIMKCRGCEYRTKSNQV